MSTEYIGIVGLGKIGQALAAQILLRGCPVVGVDTNKEIVSVLKESSLKSAEPGVAPILNEAARNGRLLMDEGYDRLIDCSAVIVCIPLMVDKNGHIDDELFLSCFEKLAPFLCNSCLLSVETSIPVGYSRSKIFPVLKNKGKNHSTDFFLVHSPERIKSGSMLQQMNTNPKIIGGLYIEDTQRAMNVYSQFLDRNLLRPVKSIETAEMIKLAGMVYRDVNIALSNQLACYAQAVDLDIVEVIEHANTDGEAFLLQPGIGVGGHCTPVYPYFLIDGYSSIGMDFVLARESRKINDGMAEVLINRALYGAGFHRVLILGLGFRPGVKEDAFSTSYIVHDLLMKRGLEVALHDPVFDPKEIIARGFFPQEDIYYPASDLVILVTAHHQYGKINWRTLAQAGTKRVVDGRNVLDPEQIRRAGLEYIGVGRGGI